MEITPNEKYTRVIPRDLFNEAKLLKCIGRLCLLIHDHTTPVKMRFTHKGGAFKIGQFDFDGSLTVTNVRIWIKDDSFTFKTRYNSKWNYPLCVWVDDTDLDVFDDHGEFTPEFIELCESL